MTCCDVNRRLEYNLQAGFLEQINMFLHKPLMLSRMLSATPAAGGRDEGQGFGMEEARFLNEKPPCRWFLTLFKQWLWRNGTIFPLHLEQFLFLKILTFLFLDCKNRLLIRRLSGLPWWLRGKEPACECRRLGFDHFVGKIPWRGNCNPL